MADAGLPAFELADLSGRLGAFLHRAGVTVTTERSVRFLDALRLVPPVDRRALYWATRLAFVSGRDQLPAFDQAFASVFGWSPTTEEADAPPSATDVPTIGRRPMGTDDDADDEDEPTSGQALGSAREALAHKDFAAVDADELAILRLLLASLVVRTPVRRTRRAQPDPHGRQIDLRRTLRHSQRTGGDAVRLARRHNRLRRRRLVLLCDISGSMEAYSRAYLCFAQRAAAGVAAETFVFATQVTRLTAVLRSAGPEVALQRAGATAPDWSGGTRIGHALAEFNDRYGRRGMARGAVVVIFSDGWESESAESVGREMARLARLAHRIVWVNPRKAAAGYEPLTGGMAAALPHCHSFVSGHSFAALADVIDAIADPVPGGARSVRRRPPPGRAAPAPWPAGADSPARR